MAAITITDVGRNLLRDGLKSGMTANIKYMAFGTDSTAPASSQTRLVAEAFRKAVTSYTNGTTGEVLVNVYLSPGDIAGIAIAEIGFFAGSTASTGVNTGVMLARGLYSHTKLNTESITFVLDFSAT